MWPEIARLLQEAEVRDWSRPMIVVPANGEPKDITVRTFGSFEAVYAELVEPWLGSWAELRRTYARFKAGEVTQEQGQEEIQARLGGHGGDRRSAEARKDQPCPDKVEAYNTAKHWRLRLAREAANDPEAAALWDQVRAGEIKPTTAARKMGWRRPRTPYGDMLSGWKRSSDVDRERFMEFIDGWLREREDAA
jgi:hypothetical protein